MKSTLLKIVNLSELLIAVTKEVTCVSKNRKSGHICSILVYKDSMSEI